VTPPPPAAPESSHDVKEIALQRVVALGRQWLSDEPEQLLSHFKRQAEQLLALRSELQACQVQLQECQAELQQLTDEQRRGNVAPLVD
jgi:transposase